MGERPPRRWLPFFVFGLAFLGGVLGPFRTNSGVAGISKRHYDESTRVWSVDDRTVLGTGWLVRESRDWLIEEGGRFSAIDDLWLTKIRDRFGHELKPEVTWHFDPVALGMGLVVAAFLAGVSGFWWNWLRAWALQAAVGGLTLWALARGFVGLLRGLVLVPPEVALTGTSCFVGLLVTLGLTLFWRRRVTPEGAWEMPSA